MHNFLFSIKWSNTTEAFGFGQLWHVWQQGIWSIIVNKVIHLDNGVKSTYLIVY